MKKLISTVMMFTLLLFIACNEEDTKNVDDGVVDVVCTCDDNTECPDGDADKCTTEELPGEPTTDEPTKPTCEPACKEGTECKCSDAGEDTKVECSCVPKAEEPVNTCTTECDEATHECVCSDGKCECKEKPPVDEKCKCDDDTECPDNDATKCAPKEEQPVEPINMCDGKNEGDECDADKTCQTEEDKLVCKDKQTTPVEPTSTEPTK